MKLIIKIVLCAAFCFVIFFLARCDSTEPPTEAHGLVLELKDVSCTEAWIELSTINLQIPATILLKQNNQTRTTINLVNPDTLLCVDSLLPNQTYSFQSVIQSINQASNELSVTTMDTTSHNFTFETFTFGTIGNSTLYDCAILSPENIWAVGEISIADTSLNGYTTYNAVHWDGSQWELKRILYQGSFWAIRTVFALNENDIWFSAFVRYDGHNFIELPIPPILNGWTINKIWGRSSNDLYAVGNDGNIAHYQNWQWSKITSGTDVDLKDIYGTPDGKELWTCGWSNQNGRVTILKVNKNAVESIWDSQTNTELIIYSRLLLNTLCANGNNEFLFATGVVIRHSLLDKRIARYEWVNYLNGKKVLELGNYAYKIRASNKNNIIVAGDAAMIWHFNGKSWYKFDEIYNTENRLYGLFVTDNLIVAVGRSYSTGFGDALLIIGSRN
jgi:hypothetical protein